MCQGCNRREFMGVAAVGGALLASQLMRNSVFAAEGDPDWPPMAPAKIYRLFVGRTGDAYLTHPTEEIEKFNQYFTELEKKLGDVQFLGGDLVPPADVAAVAEKAKDADALFIVHLSGHGGDPPVISKLIDVGLPTVLFSQPFSGHHWMYFPQWHKEGKRVVLMPTSDWSEIDRGVGLLRVPAKMKRTRILAIGGPHGSAAACDAAQVKAKLGADLVTIPNERVLQVCETIDAQAAVVEAEEYWLKPAREIIEPTREEIIASARYYLAVRRIMIEEQAQAVCSVHCMGNPRGCLTFSKLNDLGYVGACEGDIDSTLTMLLFAYAFRVPGFITDPVIDTAKNGIVHFHCTSATKLDGPEGERQPFVMRTQTDSRGGVALQVENRVGQRVTCAKLANLDTLLYTPGTITETSKNPLACRTQFTQEVPDARRLFLNWGADVVQGDMMTLLHRVVFYGDYQKPLEDLCTLMGLKLLEEGGVA
jgi:hypothetical protein